METKQYSKLGNMVSALLIKNFRVADISERLCNLIGFSGKELLGKNVEEVSGILRFNFDLEKGEFDDSKNQFLFSKSLEAIEVTVRAEKIGLSEVVYFIREVSNSRIDEKMPLVRHLLLDKEVGVAIFSLPDITLLEANQTWLNFLDEPFNRREESMGRRISEFITGWKGSTSEELWKNFLQKGEAVHLGEYSYNGFERGITYWDANLIPIYEDGRMKYAVEMTKDITERVVQRRIMEEQARTIQEQKRKLEAVFENINDMVSIVDSQGNYIQSYENMHRLLNVEKINNVRELYESAEFYDFDGRRLSIDEMPPSRVIRGEAFRNYKVKVLAGGNAAYFSITGTPVFDEKGQLEMGIMVSHDITEDIVKSKIIEEQKTKLEVFERNSAESAHGR